MARYYDLTVGTKRWRSQSSGSGNLSTPLDDPGALNVEFDFFEYLYGSADQGGDSGGSTLTIHGIALEDLQGSQNYVGQNISMSAGMSAGLPLAKPAQAGLVLQGAVYQSFGNWIGTEMTLDFVIVPSGFTVANAGNFVFSWQPGQSLQDALRVTLAAAYANVSPAPTVTFQLTGQYAPIATGVLGRYTTLRNLSTAVNSMTKAASPNGTGVNLGFVLATNSILVFDGAQAATAPIQIDFTDLVGQPTWVAASVIQITTVMRADIVIGSSIKMPQGLQDAPGFVTVTGGSFPSQLALKYKTAFQGIFSVISVRQIGNFRDPPGTSWITVIQATPQGT